ncbi:glycosyltransferase family 2 protein [Patescibacteria group bacterium]
MKLIINIPAYNEEKTIVEVIKNIPSRIEGIDNIEIVVVDDGSIDNTVKRVQSETNGLVISHGQNKGVGVAFHTGVDYALKHRADILVNIDADSQFNPLDVAKIIQPILDNQADFITGSRFINKQFIPGMPGIKLWGNKKVAGLISRLINKKFYDVSCGFRAFNKEALLNLNLFGQFTYTQEVFLDLSFKGLRIKEVPINVRYFVNRQSRVYKGAFHYAINILKIILKTMRDYRPLKFFGTIGFVVFLSGLFFDFFIIIFFIQTGAFTPHKWVGFMGIFLNIIGLIILVLALVIDMLYRVRMNQEKILYYQKKKFYSSKL